ncbi:MAG: tyrosine-type recombinase/integrase [Dehalococcoidia bacterium]|nr:tyrosine-type recombinase/integrase [Dehalococcoidia bacterium]
MPGAGLPACGGTEPRSMRGNPAESGAKTRRRRPSPLATARGLRRSPIFPKIHTDDELKVNESYRKPREHLQRILRDAGRPKATLHSFRHTFSDRLRDLGLSIEDRQILMAHSSSETTEIYTHPNFELAAEFVNRIPNPGTGSAAVTKM